MLISTIYKFRITFFNYCILVLMKEESQIYLLINYQIYNHNTRPDIQMSILLLNMSQTNHCVQHNGVLGSLPNS